MSRAASLQSACQPRLIYARLTIRFLVYGATIAQTLWVRVVQPLPAAAASLLLFQAAAPNRIFNIEWRAVYFNDHNQTANFEVRLYENSANQRFDFIFGTVQPGSDQLYVSGVQGASNAFTQDFCDANPPAAGSRTYTCPGGGGTPTPTPTATATATVTASATPTATATATLRLPLRPDRRPRRDLFRPPEVVQLLRRDHRNSRDREYF